MPEANFWFYLLFKDKEMRAKERDRPWFSFDDDDDDPREQVCFSLSVRPSVSFQQLEPVCFLSLFGFFSPDATHTSNQ